MRALRFVVIGWSVATVLLAGPWSTRPVDAQPPSGQKWCLSFHEVHPSVTVHEALQRGIPADYRIVPAADSRLGGQLLREEPVAHAGDMADAQPGFDARTREPIVTFRFNATGARKFAMFTRDNVGRPFAIVVGGRVVSAPVIREPILGGQGQISGNLTIAEAERLASRIRSGTCGEVSRLPATETIMARVGEATR